ncbi:MAG TPA: hypothetical protein PLM80_07505 [Mesotoga sp.]|jgi:multicomponent Na+:H+ antiporter subunit E|nr:hypothetical protein [Mesotoga sp.]MDI9376487.1 hypothetical protein [Thermotogota bacterium]MDD4040176.1 hypothetical protein [Mesotoga sp.]MDD4478124.1 hypothetical protein [Mesotoga sp.]MDD5744154.1 hypothetical protein [Mesotoga sp.]
MIFSISLFLWITFFGKITPAALISGSIVSGFVQYISSKLVPKGPSVRTAFKILLSLPPAIFQSFRLLFSKPVFTVRAEEIPENRIEEFGKIISVTMTPEEIVVSKDREGFLIHEVKR